MTVSLTFGVPGSVSVARVVARPTQVAPRPYARPQSGMREKLPTFEVLDEDILEDSPAAALRPQPQPEREPSLDWLDRAIAPLGAARTPWQAGDIAASALGKALRAGAVLVHLRTPETDTFRIIGAHGTRTDELIGSSDSAGTDVVGPTIVRTGKAVMMQFNGKLPRSVPARLRAVGATRALFAVSIMVDGHCVGFIEIVDAHDACLALVAQAARLVANQLSTFLGRRSAAA